MYKIFWDLNFKNMSSSNVSIFSTRYWNFSSATLCRKIKHPSLITPLFLGKILAAKPRENFGLFSYFLVENLKKYGFKKGGLITPPFLGRVGLFDRGCFISRHKVPKKFYCFNRKALGVIMNIFNWFAFIPQAMWCFPDFLYLMSRNKTPPVEKSDST